MKAEK